MQTRRQSLEEALLNILIGYGINVVANVTVLPLFYPGVTIGNSMAIGLIFTFISLVRSYGLRRFFNWYHTMVNDDC